MSYGEKKDVENGMITSTSLAIEDHGILVISVMMRFDGFEQGYVVTLGTDNAYVAIRSVLEALEVDRWESLPGHACRARREDNLIAAIGHIYKSQWSVRTEAE